MIGLRHQAGAETAGLNPVAGATAIQIDGIITPAGADPGALGQFAGVRAAELERDRMFGRVEVQQPGSVAMQNGPGRDHFGIQNRPGREQAQEKPAMPIGPVHHRGDAQPARTPAM